MYFSFLKRWAFAWALFWEYCSAVHWEHSVAVQCSAEKSAFSIQQGTGQSLECAEQGWSEGLAWWAALLQLNYRNLGRRRILMMGELFMLESYCAAAMYLNWAMNLMKRMYKQHVSGLLSHGFWFPPWANLNALLIFWLFHHSVWQNHSGKITMSLAKKGNY